MIVNVKRLRGGRLVVSLATQSGGGQFMSYDPIKLGAFLAYLINAWLAARRKK
jgi:hypothetical protein